MTQNQKINLFPVDKASLLKRTGLGALIGLILISLFLLSTGDSKPEWGEYWMIRPLIIVPLAGAIGGAFNYFVSRQNFQNKGMRVLGIIFSIIVFIVGLWLGSVIGLDGTYWN